MMGREWGEDDPEKATPERESDGSPEYAREPGTGDSPPGSAHREIADSDEPAPDHGDDDDANEAEPASDYGDDDDTNEAEPASDEGHEDDASEAVLAPDYGHEDGANEAEPAPDDGHDGGSEQSDYLQDTTGAEKLPNSELGRGFAGEHKEREHFWKHGNDFGAQSRLEYLTQADDFLNGPMNYPTLELIRQEGDRVRFNPDTDEYGVVRSDGLIRTYFKPNPDEHGYKTNLEYFYGRR